MTAISIAPRLALIIVLLSGTPALVAAQTAPAAASAPSGSGGGSTAQGPSSSGVQGSAVPGSASGTGAQLSTPGTASGSAVQPTTPSGTAAAAPTGSPPAPAPLAKNVPHIQVTEADSTLLSGATLTVPETPLGVVSKPLQFTIDNSGDAPLVLDEFAPPELIGDGSLFYLLDVSTLSMTIDPGKSTSFAVSFFPAFLGTEEATLVITSNDPATPVFRVHLSATGVENPAFSTQ